MTLKKNILIIEDDISCANLLSEFLKGNGYSTTVFYDSREAVQYMKKKEAVDMIITDIHMPWINGFELSEKSAEIVPHAEVILYSGFVTEPTNDRAYENGIFAVLQKPVKMPLLLEKVKQGLRSNRLLRTRNIIGQAGLPKILIIDDYMPQVKVLSYYFEANGFDVQVAYSGSEGIAKALIENYHFVLVDIGLPDMSGVDVIKQLHANIPTMAIYAFTGEATAGEKELAEKSGARAVFRKPMTPDKLAESIDFSEHKIKEEVRRRETHDRQQERWNKLSLFEKIQIMFPFVYRHHKRKILTVAICSISITLAIWFLIYYQNIESNRKNEVQEKSDIDKVMNIMERGEKYLQRDEQRELKK